MGAGASTSVREMGGADADSTPTPLGSPRLVADAEEYAPDAEELLREQVAAERRDEDEAYLPVEISTMDAHAQFDTQHLFYLLTSNGNANAASGSAFFGYAATMLPELTLYGGGMLHSLRQTSGGALRFHVFKTSNNLNTTERGLRRTYSHAHRLPIKKGSTHILYKTNSTTTTFGNSCMASCLHFAPARKYLLYSANACI